LYVQTPKEDGDKIGLAAQRYLINNFKLATELGGEVIKIKSSNIAKGILEVTKQKNITSVCIGKPHVSLFNILLKTAVFNQLLKKLSTAEIDLIVLS
jgi:two-component system sensor histidine kinase KdpD